MWMVFGIMIGYVVDLVFYFVFDCGIFLGFNWWLMMGFVFILVVVVCCFVYVCFELFRWYFIKNCYKDVFVLVC